MSEKLYEIQNNFSEDSMIEDNKLNFNSKLNLNKDFVFGNKQNFNRNNYELSTEKLEHLIDEIEVSENELLPCLRYDDEENGYDNNYTDQRTSKKSYVSLNKAVPTSTITSAEVTTNKEDDRKKTSHFVKYSNRDGKITKSWECGICNRSFQHQYTLTRHLPTHTNIRNFVCNECGKAFRQLSTLSQHRAIHKTDRPYVCENCNKSFNRISTLISHRKTHLEVKPYQCHMCQKSFHQKGNLRNHIFIHTNERPYRCIFCNKGFNQMSNLVCHKLKSHANEVRSTWPCNRCNMSFNKRNLLRAHELEEHQMLDRPIKSCKKASITKKLDQKTVVADNAITIPLIETEAMKFSKIKNEIPFAVLHFLEGPPLLVRVLEHESNSILRPAKREDFHALKANRKDEKDTISIPIVASVHQLLSSEGVPEFIVSQPKNIYKLMKNFIQQIAEINFEYENKENVHSAENNQYCLSTQKQEKSARTLITKQNEKKSVTIKTEPIWENSNQNTLDNNFNVKKHNPKAIAITEEENWWKNINQDTEENSHLSKTFQNIATSAFLASKTIKEDVFLDSKNEEDSPGFGVSSEYYSSSQQSQALENHEVSNLLSAMQTNGLDPDIQTIKKVFTENGIYFPEFIL